MQDNSTLEIQLLGVFCLRYQNRELRQGVTSRLESLLAYLVLHREAPIPRQRLAFLFWPDASEKQAHTNLRNLLYKLRAVLPHPDRYLYVDQHALLWRSSAPFELDVDRFAALSAGASSIQDLQEAVQAYSGDFLPDCYDDWVQSFRDSLRHTFLGILEKLLLLLGESRRLREALQYAQILLRQDPTREQTYIQLMRLHAQCGDRASVARVYKTCITVLEHELGVQPAPATQAAYQKYLAQDIEWVPSLEAAGILSHEHIPNNLPAFLTRLIGREKERVQVRDLLSGHRLMTLTGPGGIGKTRLALAVASEGLSGYRDGVFLVDLASVLDSKPVTSAIADALQARDEVRAAGLDGLKDFLSDQRLFLLLDNCEHLVEEVGLICQALLETCPQLTILITSRVALKIYGETVWQVPALPTPVQGETSDPSYRPIQAGVIRNNESAELFIDRAMSALPTFKANDEVLFSIGEICRRLEGIPLAIEMAAAQVRMLSVQQIVQRLDQATELLQHSYSGSLPRHRTMEAVMDWSHSLLTPAERKLFARLAVFSGTFSLQAAEEICQGHGIQKEEILGLLASLVDQSLVGTLPASPEVRFKLHEIVRQYIHREWKDLDQLKYWEDRHLQFFVALAESAEPELRGSKQVEWLNRLDLELENLRGALRYGDENASEESEHYLESAARLAGALSLYWFIRGWISEGRHWTEQVLASLERDNRTSQWLGKVLNAAASFCYYQGDLSEAEELSQRSLIICKANKDIYGEAFARHQLGLVADKLGNLVTAGRELSLGLKLAKYLGDPWLIYVLEFDLSWVADHEGNQDSRLEWQQKSLETARQAGHKSGMFYCLLSIAQIIFERGDTKQAALLAEEGLILAQEIGEKRGIAFALERLGCIAMVEGAYRRARDLLQQSLQIMWGSRDRDSIISCLINLSDNFVYEGKYEFTAHLLGACEAAMERFPEGYLFYNQSKYDRLVATLSNHLAEGAFTAARTLGRLMSLEQAVRYALNDDMDKPSE